MKRTCLSIDVGVINLGIVAFEYVPDSFDKEIITLKTKTSLDIPTYKKDRLRTVNQKIHDAVLEKLDELKLAPCEFDVIVIEQQMSTNTTAIRVQSILYTIFRTQIINAGSETIVVEISPQVKLKRFSDVDCAYYNIPVQPQKTEGLKSPLGARLTTRNKKKLAVEFCNARHGETFEFDEADALLQAITYLNIN